MTDIQRVRELINWLIYKGYAKSDGGVAERLGYTQSSFSQIINGKVPLSSRFVQKLCSANSQINSNWIFTGEGEMLMRPYPEKPLQSKGGDKPLRYGKGARNDEAADISDLLDVLKETTRQMKVLQAQISELISLQKK